MFSPSYSDLNNVQTVFKSTTVLMSLQGQVIYTVDFYITM